MDIGSVVDISKAIATPPAGPVTAGGQLAALKSRLKALFKTIKSVSQDGSLDAKSRKMMLQSLQAEIQMVMQRIAELENATKKKTASPIDIVMELAAEDKDSQPHMDRTPQDRTDADPLHAFLQGKRIDITA